MTQSRRNVRCPSCGKPGSRIQYGMPPGPPEPGVVLGGCVISPDNPEYACEACRATWSLLPDGTVRIIDVGVG